MKHLTRLGASIIFTLTIFEFFFEIHEERLTSKCEEVLNRVEESFD